jgi:hypothetical protein
MPDSTFVVDTNVIMVAGGRHPDVSPACVSSCAIKLAGIMENGRVAIDEGFEILGEYLNRSDPKRPKGPGDAFVKWVLRNRTNSTRCDLVRLDRGEDGEYLAFPRHPQLADFDPSDKKFVTVSAAHVDHPPLLEAADSKWLDWAPALLENGIRVDFLCPDDVKRFRKRKLGK